MASEGDTPQPTEASEKLIAFLYARESLGSVEIQRWANPGGWTCGDHCDVCGRESHYDCVCRDNNLIKTIREYFREGATHGDG